MATLNDMHDILFSSNNLCIFRGEEVVLEHVQIKNITMDSGISSIGAENHPCMRIDLKSVGEEINLPYGSVGAEYKIGTKEENFDFIMTSIDFSSPYMGSVTIDMEGFAYNGERLNNGFISREVKENNTNYDLPIKNRFIYMDFED